MELNNPSDIVKTLTFGVSAREQIIEGVDKLASAVKITLGASGKCVIYEDAFGRPVITKDGVTVAESVVLLHPVENIGATLIKEAARNTVSEAGDGTTTATVLADSLLKIANKSLNDTDIRELKEGIISGADKVKKYLNKTSIPVKGEMLKSVATISCNNDKELGAKIGEAYEKVGKNGIVLMEESETNETYVDFVEGVQFDSKLKSPHFATNKDKGIAVLDDPYVLIVSSPIPNIRRIQTVLEHVIKTKRSLLIVADVEQQPFATLLSNKVKGNIKINIVDAPGFGPTRQETIEDLAILTGAKIISEELGDDLDLIDPSVLGSAVKSVTDDKNTVLQVVPDGTALEDRINMVVEKIKNETNAFFKKKLEQRLSMLTGQVGIIYVGGDSKVELKEKKDRVEDAIHATKAAYKEGIVPGGGIALLNAADAIKPKNRGEEVLLEAIRSPYYTILDNAGIVEIKRMKTKGKGINVITGEEVDMVKSGIIDPVLVTKSALKNAVSVVTTIISADCIISNKRMM
jgi:chaperonin GroEL